MGFNTVAVLYNDHVHRIREDGPIGREMAEAILQWPGRGYVSLPGYFGVGKVVSQAHADYSQVVIVGRNNGCMASEAKDLDWYALDQMKACLERHGYKVTKLRKPKPALTTGGENAD